MVVIITRNDPLQPLGEANATDEPGDTTLHDDSGSATVVPERIDPDSPGDSDNQKKVRRRRTGQAEGSQPVKTSLASDQPEVNDQPENA